MTQERHIMAELGEHWVLWVKTGFEVYRNIGTHSVRVAQIGYKGIPGLIRAKREMEKRENKLEV